MAYVWNRYHQTALCSLGQVGKDLINVTLALSGKDLWPAIEKDHVTRRVEEKLFEKQHPEKTRIKS